MVQYYYQARSLHVISIVFWDANHWLYKKKTHATSPTAANAVFLWYLPHTSATHFRIVSIRLLNVACGLLVHSFSTAVCSCWILARTGTRCLYPKHPKHSQWWVTCPVSTLAMRQLECFSLPGIVHRSLQHGAVHYHAVTWGEWMVQRCASGSLCI